MADKGILKKRYYHGLLPREDIKEMLTKPGEYLIRMTEPVKGEKRQFVLSAVGEKMNTPTHFVIRESEKHKVFVDQIGFDTIVELVAHYVNSKDPIFTKDKKHKVVLKTAVELRSWELQHEDVELTKKLGEGAFGEVWKGKLLKVLDANQQPALVAVKTAKLESMTKEQIKEIMREARLMRNLDHINVVKFHGVATGTEPLYVIMELADGGALDSALGKLQLPMLKKYELIYQASSGLAYIHDKNLIHRDVAARNCLYGGGQVKIADFGLSREGTEYKMDVKKKVPIRWLPPETIRSGLYTPKSDVFAFGVLAWEITEDGKEPYPGLKVVEVATKVLQGYRMPFNSEVNAEFGSYILAKCWPDKYEERASTKEICKWLKAFTKAGDAGSMNEQATGTRYMGFLSTPKLTGKKTKNNSKEKISKSSSLSSGGSTAASPSR